MKNTTNYKNEFNKKNYDQFLVSLPKGQKEEWKAEATNRAQSLNAFVQTAVKFYIENCPSYADFGQNGNENGKPS